MELKLQSLEEFLAESKQVGFLYHYTSYQFLLDILHSNRLNKIAYPWVSFTRNKNYHIEDVFDVNTHTRLVIDGNKLSNKYKIKSINNGVDNEVEQEEAVYKDISDIKKYIVRIDVEKTDIVHLENVEEDVAEDVKFSEYLNRLKSLTSAKINTSYDRKKIWKKRN